MSVRVVCGPESVNGVGRGRGHLCGRPGNPSGGHGRGHRDTGHPGGGRGRGRGPCGPYPCLCPSRRRTSTWGADASLATETAVKSGGKVLPSYSDCPVSAICLVAPLGVWESKTKEVEVRPVVRLDRGKRCLCLVMRCRVWKATRKRAPRSWRSLTDALQRALRRKLRPRLAHHVCKHP